MQGHKNFWDKNAGRYDRFMRKDWAAYDEMYELIRPLVRHKTVLELAAGTGLIAKHIVPQLERALQEIKRVLKGGGVLIAPTFTHVGNSFFCKVKAFFMKLAGFPLHSRWTSEEYLNFLRQNGWTVRKSAVLRASFPLSYAECVKTEV